MGCGWPSPARGEITVLTRGLTGDRPPLETHPRHPAITGGLHRGPPRPALEYPFPQHYRPHPPPVGPQLAPVGPCTHRGARSGRDAGLSKRFRCTARSAGWTPCTAWRPTAGPRAQELIDRIRSNGQEVGKWRWPAGGPPGAAEGPAGSRGGGAARCPGRRAQGTGPPAGAGRGATQGTQLSRVTANPSLGRAPAASYAHGVEGEVHLVGDQLPISSRAQSRASG